MMWSIPFLLLLRRTVTTVAVHLKNIMVCRRPTHRCISIFFVPFVPVYELEKPESEKKRKRKGERNGKQDNVCGEYSVSRAFPCYYRDIYIYIYMCVCEHTCVYIHVYNLRRLHGPVALSIRQNKDVRSKKGEKKE
ncbi:hypothetical protein, unlikely [Trypanosoma brucei gambiense DAL972]|uniref:T. brucei spp.-specific protein n=1 Tax=Trypanosoma brucei gambiense (strain MHOM/CI/86/DAL972) TaxID=679716 RepID=D0A1W4_TRYB9|nr:hypothetical protein, unlikely [Trypanosoma brucei gambiense DAL972]CBH15257.1 hypothetical protein, unlikely [Trypanosoma brucei gambiense DAL972]|eukprot:XP_011777522.1 hypothetical protein, unlikely [Trypanosoma brucei gambiense DAL972]